MNKLQKRKRKKCKVVDHGRQVEHAQIAGKWDEQQKNFLGALCIDTRGG